MPLDPVQRRLATPAGGHSIMVLGHESAPILHVVRNPAALDAELLERAQRVSFHELFLPPTPSSTRSLAFVSEESGGASETIFLMCIS